MAETKFTDINAFLAPKTSSKTDGYVQGQLELGGRKLASAAVAAPTSAAHGDDDMTAMLDALLAERDTTAANAAQDFEAKLTAVQNELKETAQRTTAAESALAAANAALEQLRREKQDLVANAKQQIDRLQAQLKAQQDQTAAAKAEVDGLAARLKETQDKLNVAETKNITLGEAVEAEQAKTAQAIHDRDAADARANEAVEMLENFKAELKRRFTRKS